MVFSFLKVESGLKMIHKQYTLHSIGPQKGMVCQLYRLLVVLFITGIIFCVTAKDLNLSHGVNHCHQEISADDFDNDLSDRSFSWRYLNNVDIAGWPSSDTYLHSKIFTTARILNKMSSNDLDDYSKRSLITLNLLDIHWCLYLYLHDRPLSSDSLKRFNSLDNTISMLLTVSRKLQKVDRIMNRKVDYNLDGLVSLIDTVKITYDQNKIVKIGDFKIGYSGDLLSDIGNLAIKYNMDLITVIGEREYIDTRMCNLQFKKMAHTERTEYLNRQKVLCNLIGIYNVLCLYIENVRTDHGWVEEKYIHLLKTVKAAIEVSQRIECVDEFDGKKVTWKFGLLDQIGESYFTYSFQHVTKINDIKIEYFFEHISQIDDMKVSWFFDDIVQVGNQKIKEMGK